MKTIFATRGLGAAVMVAALALWGCASTQALTQGEVGRSGARQFGTAKGTTFAICVGALTAEGYEIASSDPATGEIVTLPQAVHTSGPVTARAYRVTVTPEGQGSRVVAQPILYAGTRDVSNRDVWVLDGPEGERAQWADLFSVMDAALVTPAVNGREAVAASGESPPSLAKEQAAAPSQRATSPAEQKAGGLRPAGLSTQ
jgi:hypothetical protein